MVFLWVYHPILTGMFLIWKINKACSVVGNAWVCLKDWLHGLSVCLSWPVIKLFFSHLVWEIPSVLIHDLPDKKHRHSYAPGNRPDWFVRIVINHSVYLTKNVRCCFLIRTIGIRISSGSARQNLKQTKSMRKINNFKWGQSNIAFCI